MNASFPKLFHQVIITGYIAAIVFVLLLITSNYGVQRKLGKTWRTIHALIWFVLPLSLLHALMAARYYTGDLPIVALLSIGGLGLFGIGKIVLPKSNLKETIRDALFVIFGVFFAIGVVLLYPTDTPSVPIAMRPTVTIAPSRLEITLSPSGISTEKPMSVLTPQPTSAPPSASQGLSMQDVAQHSSPSDCYVAYQGVVYDITSYLPNHPGGARRAAQMCGRNIDMFSDQHSGGSFSSPQAQEMLAPLEVGKLK